MIADGRSDVGVLFADIADFTPMSERMTPDAVVQMLNELFTAFDGLATTHGIEKIKTVGDAYMAASGLLNVGSNHAERLAAFALDMQDTASQMGALRLRVGIDIGPVVAGVIGRHKFIYDVWGDTVNTASRMESHGVAGSIQVTERAYRNLSPAFEFDQRGLVDVKGKGPMLTYWLRSRGGEVWKTR